MNLFRACAVLIMLALGALSAYPDTASVGSMWKQINSTLYTADDVTAVDLSGGSVTFDSISTTGSVQIGTTLEVNGFTGIGLPVAPDKQLQVLNEFSIYAGGAERILIDYDQSVANTSVITTAAAGGWILRSSHTDAPPMLFELHDGTSVVERIRIDGDTGNVNFDSTLTFTAMTTIFSDYSAINNMNQILCDATSGDVDIHIVSASGTKGLVGNVKKIDVSANDCTIEPAGGETIDGAANLSIASQWENITFFSDDTNLLIR